LVFLLGCFFVGQVFAAELYTRADDTQPNDRIDCIASNESTSDIEVTASILNQDGSQFGASEKQVLASQESARFLLNTEILSQQLTRCRFEFKGKNDIISGSLFNRISGVYRDAR